MSITNSRMSDNAVIGADGERGGNGGLAEGGGIVNGFSVLFGLADTASLLIRQQHNHEQYGSRW